jgi:hypothetical protein
VPPPSRFFRSCIGVAISPVLTRHRRERDHDAHKDDPYPPRTWRRGRDAGGGGLALAGSTDLRSSRPPSGEGPMSDRVLGGTPSRQRNFVRSIVHHLPGGDGELLAIENDFAIWRAFNNHSWPALYFAGAQGQIRRHHFGKRAAEVLQDGEDVGRLAGARRAVFDVAHVDRPGLVPPLGGEGHRRPSCGSTGSDFGAPSARCKARMPPYVRGERWIPCWASAAWMRISPSSRLPRSRRTAAMALSSTFCAGWRGPKGRSASPGHPSSAQRRRMTQTVAREVSMEPAIALALQPSRERVTTALRATGSAIS